MKLHINRLSSKKRSPGRDDDYSESQTRTTTQQRQRQQQLMPMASCESSASSASSYSSHHHHVQEGTLALDDENTYQSFPGEEEEDRYHQVATAKAAATAKPRYVEEYQDRSTLTTASTKKGKQQQLDHHPSYSTAHRGFATSIQDMYASTNSEKERVDCCAFTCCGVLQSDYNRYVTLGIEPPPTSKRLGVHLLMPLSIFILAMASAVLVKDPFLNSMLSTGFVFTLFTYWFVTCLKGTWKRQEIRNQIMWAKYHLMTTGNFRPRPPGNLQYDHDDDDSQSQDSRVQDEVPLPPRMGQTAADIKWAHTFCGCYRSDRAAACPTTPMLSLDHHDDDDDDNDDASNSNTCRNNICHAMFRVITTSCNVLLGCCGRCFCQCCGICATAQEGRELLQLVPAGYRRIDYITMQPYMAYYPAIYQERLLHHHQQEYDGNHNKIRWLWWKELSHLSQCIITALLVLVTLLILLIVHRTMAYGFKEWIVVLTTVFQFAAFFKFINWKFPYDTISNDAMLKFFASGFCLSTCSALCCEIVVGIVVRLIMATHMTIAGISVVQDNGYSSSSTSSMSSHAGYQASSNGGNTVSYDEFYSAYGKDHPIIHSLYLAINCFIIAALTEELCKYFGYRMVEHPDFLSRGELEEAADCYQDQQEERLRRRGGRGGGEQPPQQRQTYNFDQQDQRSFESHGARITIAMIAVSLGFACCENVMYVIIYGTKDFAVPVIVLLARSLFPVHPIAAALQSVGVVRRDIEEKYAPYTKQQAKTTTTSLNRIVLSSIVFHGWYDFLLMWIGFMMTKDGNYAAKNDRLYVPNISWNGLSLVLSCVTIFLGFVYYYRQAILQRRRLRAMDGNNSEVQMTDGLNLQPPSSLRII